MTADNRYLQRSSRYPLQGGKATGVTAPFVEIVDAQEIIKLDPTVLLHRVRTGQLALGNPFTDSILSGKPGYLFRTEQVELALTAEEIGRLVLRNLLPAQFLELASRIGVFQEICGAYYDEETGKALSPRFTEDEDKVGDASAKVPHLLLIEDLDGNLRPHSITTLEQAQKFVAELSNELALGARILAFDGPKHAWRADPFDNFIALHTGPQGQMRVYGRFMTRKDAENFMPRDGSFGYGTPVLVASVNATAVF